MFGNGVESHQLAVVAILLGAGAVFTLVAEVQPCAIGDRDRVGFTCYPFSLRSADSDFSLMGASCSSA